MIDEDEEEEESENEELQVPTQVHDTVSGYTGMHNVFLNIDDC